MTPGGARSVSARARSRRSRRARPVTPAALILALVALEEHAVAGGVPPVHLALPVLTTLGLGRPLVEVRLGAGIDDDRATGFRARARAALGFLPAALRVPDRYAVDVADRSPAGFAAP